jgi:hypothetical protein
MRSTAAAAHRGRWGAVVLILSTLLACGGPDQSPEMQIKSLISQAEQAAESRDISVFKNITADDYQDRRGLHRREVLRIVQGEFLRNQEIHLLSLVRSLTIKGDSAHARVLVAMAGQPIESPGALLKMRARLMRFEIDFALEGDEWQVLSVDWQPAKAGDFL